MYQRTSPLRVLNQEYPFILPQPIPEPPRVINARASVPDLSITSEHNFASFEHKPGKKEVRFPAAFGSHEKTGGEGRQVLSHPLKWPQFASHFPPSLKPTSPPIHAYGGGHFGAEGNPRGTERKANAVNVNVPFSAYGNSTPSRATLRETETRHTKGELGADVNKERSNFANERDMYRILKHQEEQLNLITRQVEELLRIHNIEGPNPSCSTPKARAKPQMCSVETMTSLVWPEGSPKRAPKDRKGSRKSPPHLANGKENARLPTIDERLYTRSPGSRINREDIDSTGSYEAEKMRGSTSSCDDFYDHMLANIDDILQQSSCDSEGDITRSSCSPTPPRAEAGRRGTRGRDKGGADERQVSEQTIYINRLASKYLVRTESQPQPRRRGQKKRQGQGERRWEGEAPLHKRGNCALDAYGFTRETSIATKNYLEKYGLVGGRAPDGPSPGIDHYARRGERPLNWQTIGNNRILDLDRLKKQPKFK